ncbi:MAG TPA: DegQ family serine endoprotease [Steroidobacteraceae bacterium]|nr:DegQ family serine endoprotease [Steroidobacteraceae bacterium]
MSFVSFLRKPLVVAMLAAATIAVPVGALYYSGAAHAAPAASAPVASAQVAPAPAANTAAASGPTITLPDFSAMVQKYGPAVVNISVTTKVSASYNPQGDDSDENDEGDGDSGGQGGKGGGNQNPFGPGSPFAPFFRGFGFQMPHPQPMHGEGSGFIIRGDGVILTNAHVVKGASEVTVRLTDRREYTAKVLGVDSKSDIAVIKIEAKDLPTVKLGDSRSLKVGEWVLAIGAPFGFENSATAGIVSAKGRSLDSGYVPFIQTDVPINPGNSGGPLFNMRGEVVGINSQIYSRSGGYQGVSFSIPIDVAMQVEQQLQATGHVTRGKLGVVIQNVTQGLADSFGLPQPEGALVSSVEKDGPSAHAGVEPGDVILKLNGEPIASSNELPVKVASLSPGTSVSLEIWRNHAARTVSVKLGALDEQRTAARGESQHGGGKLGLAVRPLTGDEQRQGNVQGGLLVEQSSGPAAEAGIQPGDIVLSANGAPVSSAAALKSAVESSKGHVALLIQRGEARIFVPVRVG